MKISNKKAYYDYSVIEEFISGVMLVGSEVKSIFRMDFNFGDSYILINNNEVFVKNFSISKYKDASIQNHEELRDRKLLLKKKEIVQILKLKEQNGTTIVPLELFTMNGKIKLKIGVCRGKKNWDKRDSIKKRDIERQEQRKF